MDRESYRNRSHPSSAPLPSLVPSSIMLLFSTGGVKASGIIIAVAVGTSSSPADTEREGGHHASSSSNRFIDGYKNLWSDSAAVCSGCLSSFGRIADDGTSSSSHHPIGGIAPEPAAVQARNKNK